MSPDPDAVTIVTSSDGEPIALHDFGGNGPPVLLGHGNGLNAGMWAAALPDLRPRVHCYGLDLRGHGRSRPRDANYSVARDRFADDVLACVDHLGAPLAYAGHSLGGASAVFAAARRPDAFTRLWLFEPVVIPRGHRPDGGPSFLVEAARRRRATFESVDDAVERLGSKPPFAGCDPTAVRGYLEIGLVPHPDGVTLACRPEDEARVFGSGEDVDLDWLAAVEVPTVVVAGRDDGGPNALPTRIAPLIAEGLGAARFERHEHVTHFGPMEDPAGMARSILAHVLDP